MPSRRPQEFRTSSIRPRVSSSLAILKGYPITFVLGWSLEIVSIRVV